jgi:hypothetical protein
VARSNTSPTKQREIVDPDVGIRWGKEASFEFSTAGLINGTLQPGQKGLWVEIEENNDNPPRRRKEIPASLDISRGLAHIEEHCFSWAPTMGRAVFLVPTDWTLEFTETLPKRHLGELGNPVRRTKYIMSRAAGVFD